MQLKDRLDLRFRQLVSTLPRLGIARRNADRVTDMSLGFYSSTNEILGHADGRVRRSAVLRRAVHASSVPQPVGSGDEIHTIRFCLGRFDFLGSLDPILIRFDRGGGCAAGFVCDKPDFRLTDDNMRWVCWTDGAHVPPLLELLQSCRYFVHGFLKGSVNAPCSFHHAFSSRAGFPLIPC
jgi:hypothetical protein